MKFSIASFASRFPPLRRISTAAITDEAELRAYVISVTALCVAVALGADIANQLTFFVDWPTSFRSWAITTTIVLVLAAPISRVIAKAQLELYRAKMMFAALTATNEAIIRASSRDVMFGAVCGAVVQAGDFTSCLIALVGGDPLALEVRAIAGSVAVEPSPRAANGRGHADGLGLSGIAFRPREACISNDYLADPRCRGLAEAARARGVRSCAALPLTRGGETVGVMVFASDHRNAFPSDIVPLLRRLADNVAFAMESFDRADMKARAEARLGHLAAHDALTDLPNRLELSRMLRAAVTAAAERRGRLAVLFIDIDYFKTINDSLGHDAGDALLIEIAVRLRRCVGAQGFVGRIGGDEFVAVLGDVAERGRIEARARDMLAAIAEPMSLAGVERRVSASIGVALYPEDDKHENGLVKKADQAMYMAKDAGKNEVRFHVARALPRALEALEREARPRRAL